MSIIYPDTRDHRRIHNSDAKTLLQNWVEEVSLNEITILNSLEIKYFQIIKRERQKNTIKFQPN